MTYWLIESLSVIDRSATCRLPLAGCWLETQINRQPDRVSLVEGSGVATVRWEKDDARTATHVRSQGRIA